MDRRRFFKTAGLSALAVAAEMTPLPLKGSELFYASETSNRETNSNKTMKHKCKITVLKRECYQDLQGKYLADPKSGPCPFFREGQEIIWLILFGSVGLHQSLCVCSPARWLYHAWMDK